MPDSTTLAILRDAVSFAVVAVTLGILVYGIRRIATRGAGEVEGGFVIARHYSLPDIYVGAMILMVMLWGIDGQGDAPKAAPAPTVQVIVASMVSMLTICVLLLLYLAVVRGLNPAELFGLRRLSFLKAAGVAIISIIPLYVIVAIIAGLVATMAKGILPDLQPQETVKAFKSAEGLPVKVMMGVAAVIVAPLVEETVFRGFIYGVLKRYTDGWFAALCSSLLFAIVHMHLGSLVPLFVLALGLCAAYERTGSLLVPMWMHALFNGVSTTLLLLFPDGPK